MTREEQILMIERFRQDERNASLERLLDWMGSWANEGHDPKRLVRLRRVEMRGCRIAYKIGFSAALSIDAVYEEERGRWKFKKGTQSLRELRAFRFGWRDGRHELFEYLMAIKRTWQNDRIT